jgi:hypothetical protein
MELASVWRSMADQGLMFWLASGAVALGVTLILCAGIIQIRRLRGRFVGKVSSLQETKVPVVHKSTNQAKIQEKSLENLNTLEAPGPRPEEMDSQELYLLLARLRSAADRLEKYRLFTRQNPASQAESPLKAYRDGVDYLFRAGTG